MNKEIKEILESLNKISKAEYYPEDLLTYKECQSLLDYITNLQEENEYSNHCNEELRKKITNLEYKIERLENELKGDNK